MKLVRIQEKGQVTLPADVRRALGLKKGDLVSVTQTDDGILVLRQFLTAGQVHPAEDVVRQVAQVIELKDAPIVAGAIAAKAEYAEARATDSLRQDCLSPKKRSRATGGSLQAVPSGCHSL